jgi:phospholipase D3/4
MAGVLAALVIACIACFIAVASGKLDPSSSNSGNVDATDFCSYALVESIPWHLPVPLVSPHNSTYHVWYDMISSAQHSLYFGEFYFSLLDGNTNVGGDEGKTLYALIEAAARRGVVIRIVQNEPSARMPAPETQALQDAGLAQVRSLDMAKLLGAGILHSKFIIADERDFYVGSANMDWRSLTQVKEIGIVLRGCARLTADLVKIFETYWYFAGVDSIPAELPAFTQSDFGASNPLRLVLYGEGMGAPAYLGAAPPQFNSDVGHRTQDIDALIGAIDSATVNVSLAVMDYLPTSLYMPKKEFWPDISNALERAVYERGVHVRVLASNWTHSKPQMKPFLQNLLTITDVCALRRVCVGGGKLEVRLFTVPEDPVQPDIPFARVSHTKYVVTDSWLWLGTSNMIKDYFANTCGVSFNTPHPFVRRDLQFIFDRDWTSSYAYELTKTM